MSEKKYTKAWLRGLIDDCSVKGKTRAEKVLESLLNNLQSYVTYLDVIDSKRGRGTSTKRKKASIANGKLGGRPKTKKETYDH